MPRVSAPSQQTVLRNHPSWGRDADAKRALGLAIAKWLASGVLEFVAWNDRLPILLQPCGAVSKGTAPFYRLITDACVANKLYSDWRVAYTTAAQLSSTLNRCDLHFSMTFLCAGFEGGCAVCEEYYRRAPKVQAMWQEKARALNIPLSAKGHAVGQRGAFTGLAIDTYKGRFYMLPEIARLYGNGTWRLGRSLADNAAYHRAGRPSSKIPFIDVFE
jgi:hypothetical protein